MISSLIKLRVCTREWMLLLLMMLLLLFSMMVMGVNRKNENEGREEKADENWVFKLSSSRQKLRKTSEWFASCCMA